MSRGSSLTRYAWLAVAAAVATIALKTAAYLLTGSIGLLSDAAESVVNLVAAGVALIVLHIAARPPDDAHHFGHSKAEYFSAALEGLMIVLAAVVIIVSAVRRFLEPQPLTHLGVGLAITVVAAVVNGVVALVLIRAGRRHRSITLEADGRHLMTDVWTSVGVIVAVLLVPVTGWWRLDPVVAFAVGVTILVTGWHLVRRSLGGLMDRSLDDAEHERITTILDSYASPEVSFHGIRTRQSGRSRFVSMHVLVPGAWSVQRGHDLLDGIEADLHEALDEVDIVTHLEPREDPRCSGESRGLSVGPPGAASQGAPFPRRRRTDG